MKKIINQSEMKLIPNYCEKTREFIRIIEDAGKEYEDNEFKNKYKSLLN